MSLEIVYRAFRDDDNVSEITAMLHLAYGSLLRMGFRYTATGQDDATTLRRLRKGSPLMAEHEGKVVGTITYYPANPDSICACYRSSPSFGQFGVHPQFQRQGIGRALLAQMEARACADSAATLALDTAEGAAHLCRWYGSLGYEFVEYVTWGTVNYRSVILAKKLAPAPAERR
ncbi:MAG: acetyltransferase domain protein [Verrucomicrobia bacterium]|nr:acetyltransferase domain protein [Verrucomicrobiota bacterium]